MINHINKITFKLFTLIAIMIGGMLSTQVIADSPSTSNIKSDKSTSAMRMPMYQPPRRGAPGLTVGGGTRGVMGDKPAIHALAPNHTGFTASEQPTLSWYMSKPSSMRFEFMLIDDEGTEPLLELTLDAAQLKRGIQSLNLADHGVKLKPGVQYQWSVSLIPEESNRSNDIVSGGIIERQTLEDSLELKLNKANPTEDVFIYAEEGYWYDAIASLTKLIEKDPGNELLKKQRAELIHQGGLAADIND
ncbi:MAG: DUF928 domain-containing protein [Gammaproteobacteria bacterium]|nr:DUF928 domain-containing protein [Gammaproteobacteria bacterium]